MRQRLIPIFLFVAISSIYYATSAGLTSSNDGSHYALLRAMVDEGRFSIQTYAHFAEGNDLAIRDEVIYSDRPPGTALVAAPFYVIGGLLPRPIHDLPTRHDEGNPRLAYLMMLPALAGAGIVVMVFLLLRMSGLPPAAALTAALALGLATTNWKYGGVLFSHSLSGFLVVASVGLAVLITRRGRLTPLTGGVLGLALGLAVVVEYSNALLALLVVLFLAGRLRRELVWDNDGAGNMRLRPFGLVALGMAALLPLAFLLAYNRANFGGLLTTSYQYAINYSWAASFATTFDVPWTQGLPGLLWYGHDALGEENQGLFLLMPVSLIGVGGLWLYIRDRWQEALLIVGSFLVYLLLFARHHTFSGFTADGRYLAPFVGLWFLPVGYGLAWVFKQDEGWQKTLLLFLVYGLIFLSVRNMVAHIVFSYNYHLDPGLVARRAATPANWSYILRSLFVNWQNLPLLWLVEGMALAVLLVVDRLRYQRDRSPI